MRLLSAHCGTLCTISDEDYTWASQFKWYVLNQGPNHIYFIRKVKVGKKWTTARLHRELMGSPEGLVIDHKDKFTLNNCRPNLRPVTQAKNTQNSRAEKASKTSKFRGVSYDKTRGRWQAQIMVNTKHKNIGRFDFEEDAAIAYNEAAAFYFGEFAQLNNMEF